jgi:hypothetical protein
MAMKMALLHHAEMLRDKVRNSKYREAIEKTVGAEFTVVDLGAGFGLLSAYARARTTGKIWAIEYFEDTAEISEKALGGLDVCTLTKASYEVLLEHSPDVLVTETIGAVGPEENIVELMYDFCERHPNINHLIPSSLCLYVQPVKASRAQESLSELLEDIYVSESPSYPIRKCSDALTMQYCSAIYQGDLSGGNAVGRSYCIASYDLGVTRSSDVSASLQFGGNMDFDCLNIYFEAALAPDVILTNRLGAPQTHWMHSFVLRPEGKSKVFIRYRSDERDFIVEWD